MSKIVDFASCMFFICMIVLCETAYHCSKNSLTLREVPILFDFILGNIWINALNKQQQLPACKWVLSCNEKEYIMLPTQYYIYLYILIYIYIYL